MFKPGMDKGKMPAKPAFGGKGAPPPMAKKKIGAREMFGAPHMGGKGPMCPTCNQPMPQSTQGGQQPPAPQPPMGGRGQIAPQSPDGGGY